MSNLMNVFTLDRAGMRDRGDFFSLMFFVVAIVVLIVYFVLGWASNMISQVRA